MIDQTGSPTASPENPAPDKNSTQTTTPAVGNLAEPLQRITGRPLRPLTAKEREQLDAERVIRETQERKAQWDERRRIFVGQFGRRYANCTFDSFRIADEGSLAARQRAVLDSLQAYAGDMRRNVSNGFGVVLYGPSGTGKDHLLTAMLIRAFDDGAKIKWINGMDFFADVRDRISDSLSEQELVRGLVEPDILAISDPLPPTGPVSPFQAQVLFRVLDRRYREMKPVLATMNVKNGEEAADRLGISVAERLKDRSLTLHCNWPSYRRAGIQ